MQLQQQRTRQQRRDDGEGRVFRSCRNEQHRAIFHGCEECVLLGFGKAVHLINKEHGSPALNELLPGVGDDLADLLDARIEGGEAHEVLPHLAGDERGNGGLAGARRPVQDDGGLP